MVNTKTHVIPGATNANLIPSLCAIDPLLCGCVRKAGARSPRAPGVSLYGLYPIDSW